MGNTPIYLCERRALEMEFLMYRQNDDGLTPYVFRDFPGKHYFSGTHQQCKTYIEQSLARRKKSKHCVIFEKYNLKEINTPARLPNIFSAGFQG